MAHHAYVITGGEVEAIQKARSFAARTLSLTGTSNPDIQLLHYGLLSVDDVRKIASTVYQSAHSDQKMVLVYSGRIFHEAQNALLKICEEPPEGVTIIIGVPSLGQLLPTLRSRLLPLPEDTVESGQVNTSDSFTDAGTEFLTLSASEREKLISKLLDRSKSDKDEIKQGARGEAAELLKAITEQTHAQFLHEVNPGKKAELRAFLEDVSAFIPLMYERSAPLKLIFEHIQLVIPKSLASAKV